MSENMISFIFFYICMAIGMGAFVVFNNPEEPKRYRMAVIDAVIWPLIWVMIGSLYIFGRFPARCAWCGKYVALRGAQELWRKHYLNECKEHPLAKRIEELEKRTKDSDDSIDQLNAGFEAQRAGIGYDDKPDFEIDQDTWHVGWAWAAVEGLHAKITELEQQVIAADGNSIMQERRADGLANDVEQLLRDNFALREAARPIPVTERLPEEGQDILVYARVYFEWFRDTFQDGRFFVSGEDVTHWLPLPEPPTKGTQE
jgi:hypothetical protein